MLRRNIALLSSSTVLGQCVLLAATPILTRYYDAAAFGGLATFSALYGVLSGIGTLRYDLAIPAPRADRQAYYIGAAVSLASISVASLVAVVLLVGPLIRPWEVPSYATLLPLCMVLVGHYGIAQQWAARRGSYSHYSISLLVNSMTNVAAALAFIALGFTNSLALVVAFTVGLAASLAYMLWSPTTGRHVYRSLQKLTHLRLVLAGAGRRLEFPGFALPTFLAAAASMALPVFILGGTYTQEQVGYYALAMRFLLSPGVLVGAAVLEAMRAELFRRQREGAKLLPVVTRVIKLGLCAGIPFLVLAYFWGGDLLVFVTGAGFTPSGDLVPPLVLAALSLILSQPMQSVFLVVGRQRAGLLAQLALTLLPNTALLIAAYRGAAMKDALTGYALAAAVTGAAYIAAAWWTAAQPPANGDARPSRPSQFGRES